MESFYQINKNEYYFYDPKGQVANGAVKTYSNSYGGYVSLGKVHDPSKLASALGLGNVQVTLSLAN